MRLIGTIRTAWALPKATPEIGPMGPIGRIGPIGPAHKLPRDRNPSVKGRPANPVHNPLGCRIVYPFVGRDRLLQRGPSLVESL